MNAASTRPVSIPISSSPELTREDRLLIQTRNIFDIWSGRFISIRSAGSARIAPVPAVSCWALSPLQRLRAGLIPLDRGARSTGDIDARCVGQSGLVGKITGRREVAAGKFEDALGEVPANWDGPSTSTSKNMTA